MMNLVLAQSTGPSSNSSDSSHVCLKESLCPRTAMFIDWATPSWVWHHTRQTSWTPMCINAPACLCRVPTRKGDRIGGCRHSSISGISIATRVSSSALANSVKKVGRHRHDFPCAPKGCRHRFEWQACKQWPDQDRWRNREKIAAAAYEYSHLYLQIRLKPLQQQHKIWNFFLHPLSFAATISVR